MRTWTAQRGMESTIRSPRSALDLPKRGSALTARAMHSVAERISGSIAADFWCIDKSGDAAGLGAFGAMATLTSSAAAASGARNIESFLSGVGILIDAEPNSPAENASCAPRCAEIRRLWCLGNIRHPDRSDARSSRPRRPVRWRRNVAALRRVIRLATPAACKGMEEGDSHATESLADQRACAGICRRHWPCRGAAAASDPAAAERGLRQRRLGGARRAGEYRYGAGEILAEECGRRRAHHHCLYVQDALRRSAPRDL